MNIMVILVYCAIWHEGIFCFTGFDDLLRGISVEIRGSEIEVMVDIEEGSFVLIQRVIRSIYELPRRTVNLYNAVILYAYMQFC